MSAPGQERPELVVLLAEDGTPIGTAPKSEVHHRDTPLHLAFSCYLFDPDGRLLLTRRAWSKKTWPGAWTNSCCGHPGPGEPVDQAVQRRVEQELGVQAHDLRMVLPDFRYRAVMPDGTVENEVCPVFTAVCDDPAALRPDASEVAEHAWISWTEFRDDVVEGGRDVSPWCREQVEALPRELPPR
ncbi:isopentenyl-diphosphate Delta-isomerase [Nocardioides sp. LHG3406-4]|uniref:isopentenyl-diphosphate Delta-isomerase n=1 Tax=Nocardioides sp. LHG3406-4 TaxID=2804575 RepID=UPI003CF72571